MNGLSPRNITKHNIAAISGVVTNKAISEETGLTAGGALHLRVMIEVSAVTVVGSVTAKLQMRSPSGVYTDLVGANASTTISATGTVSIRQNVEIAADQPNMPLMSMVQVVITTTNAGDALTVSKVWLQQEL